MSHACLIESKVISRQNRAWNWLDERLGLQALRYEVPRHANSILYTLGGITLGGLLILLVTGLYLTQFYHPHPGAEARDSILYIITRVRFGEFVRGVHAWAGVLVIVTAVLHMVRVFITASYKRPRELNWVIGVLMLTVLMALFFTGTVLKWDQEAYEALQHNEAVAKLLGRAGTFFTNDYTASTPLLTRLSFLHTALLPAVLGFLILAHLFLVKRHGISQLPLRGERAVPGIYESTSPYKSISFFNLHLRQLIGYSMLLAAIGALLALALPVSLGEPVVPGREVTKPPWLFYWLYAFENWWGIKALLWVSLSVPVGLLLVPLVDRNPFRHMINRKAIVILAAAVALAWVALTVYVGLTPTVEHIGMGD